MAIDLDDPIALMLAASLAFERVGLQAAATRDRDLEDARSVVDKQRGRLDETLMEREIAALAGEITDHDIRARFDKIHV